MQINEAYLFKVELNALTGVNCTSGSKILLELPEKNEVMGGKPCIRGMRVTVGTIVGLIASGYSHSHIFKAYPYLEEADIYEALAYAAWRIEEIEVPRMLNTN